MKNLRIRNYIFASSGNPSGRRRGRLHRVSPSPGSHRPSTSTRFRWLHRSVEVRAGDPGHRQRKRDNGEPLRNCTLRRSLFDDRAVRRMTRRVAADRATGDGSDGVSPTPRVAVGCNRGGPGLVPDVAVKTASSDLPPQHFVSCGTLFLGP